MTREEELKRASSDVYPENISYSTVIEQNVDYNWKWREKWLQGAEWADEHPRKDLVEINKVYIWLSDFLDEHYIEDRDEAEEINADLVLKSFLKAVKGE